MKSIAYSSKTIIFYSLILFVLLILINPLSYLQLQKKEPRVSFEISGSSVSYVVDSNVSKQRLRSGSEQNSLLLDK